jgi:hypothetical protein
MRPFGIELSYEGIEAALLLQAVEAWRACCFLLESFRFYLNRGIPKSAAF